MRVTNKMISDQVVGNLAYNIEKFMRLETMMSSGRRINKSSDDPIGTAKDLGFRAKLSQLEQFQKNISHGKAWLSHVDLAFAEMNDLLIRAKEIAVAMANDTYDEIARLSAATDVESIFEQILQSGNSKFDNRYLFSGHRTLQAAFRASGVGVVYEGDNGDLKVEVEAGSKIVINTPGSSVLTRPFTILGDEADLLAGVDGNTLLSDLNDGRGVDLSPGMIEVTDTNLNITVTVDLSLATDLNDAVTSINSQLAAGGIDNITASLGLEGNNIRFTATDRPEVSLSTALENLNRGAGVDMLPPKIEIHNFDHSTSVIVDMAGAETLGDVIGIINSQLAAAGVANVTASLNPAGTGLQLRDTNGVPLGLVVSEFDAGSSTAKDLGIVGPIDPTLVGSDLNPRPDFYVAEFAGGNTAADLGIFGDANYELIGFDLDPLITPTMPISLFNNGIGYTLGRIRISQGDTTAIVDLDAPSITTVQDLIDALNGTGLAIHAEINSISKGISITNTDPNCSLVVEDVEGSKPAQTLGIAGSPDVMGNLLLLIDALRENDNRLVSSVIGGLDASLNELLNLRASAGAKVVRLEATELRLSEYNLNFTRLLSETEDADITRLVTDLAQQEAVYQSALNAAARILQPTLLDFLE